MYSLTVTSLRLRYRFDFFRTASSPSLLNRDHVKQLKPIRLDPGLSDNRYRGTLYVRLVHVMLVVPHERSAYCRTNIAMTIRMLIEMYMYVCMNQAGLPIEVVYAVDVADASVAMVDSMLDTSRCMVSAISAFNSAYLGSASETSDSCSMRSMARSFIDICAGVAR